MVGVALPEHDFHLVVGVEGGIIGEDVKPAAFPHVLP